MTDEIDICYKSTTFCDGANGRCLKFKTCPLDLTEKVKKKAQKWWEANGDTTEDGPAIAIIAAPSKMDCYEAPRKVAAPKEDDVTEDDSSRLPSEE